MSNRRAACTLLSGRQESQLRRLRRGLQDQGLLCVLDSFPASDKFTFGRTRHSGHDAITLSLGHRQQTTGAKAHVWACIVGTIKDFKPQVVFYEEEPLRRDDPRTIRYPRSASSLLRRATELHPPFCFLQVDPHDEAKDLRRMICAIVLYQFLVAGLDIQALQWAQFESGLTQALRYIDSRAVYHIWRHEQRVALLKPPKASGTKQQTVQEDLQREVVTAQADEPSEDESPAANNDGYPGGTVRSRGSAVIVKPHTSLSKLKALLGNKFQLLDSIPANPISISSHNLKSTNFPFRLHLGTHDWGRSGPLPVYVYPTHDAKSVMRILSSDKGREWSWTFERLEGVNLVEPFATLWSNGANTGNKARAAKLRNMVSYYFILAENEGLIGNPRITVGEAFGKKMCAACNELQRANQQSGDSEDNYDDALDPEDAAPLDEVEEEPTELTRERESPEQPSCIVVLKLKRESFVHTVIDTSPTVAEQDERETTLANRLIAAAGPVSSPIERTSVVSVVTGGEGGLDAHLATNNRSQTPCANDLETGDNDEFVPMDISSPSWQGSSGSRTPSVHVIETRASSVSSDLAFGVSAVDNKAVSSRPSLQKAQRDSSAVFDRLGVLQNVSGIIEIFSDDEDSVTALPALENEVEATPEAADEAIDLTQLSSGLRGRKRKSYSIYDSDDDLVEEVDGRDWRQASQRR